MADLATHLLLHFRHIYDCILNISLVNTLSTSLAPLSHQTHNTSPSSTADTPKGIRILISYIYTESSTAYSNLLFFLKYGVYENADFIFIWNWPLNREKYEYVDIWDAGNGNGIGNLRVMAREQGDCFDRGT
jgi:hypothetical protein